MNKQKHPPTPTIEEQLDKILSNLEQYYKFVLGEARRPPGSALSRNEAKERLTLLITKAEDSAFKDGQVQLMKYLVANYPSETWLVTILNTVRSKATTQPSYSPAPGTDGEV